METIKNLHGNLKKITMATIKNHHGNKNKYKPPNKLTLKRLPENSLHFFDRTHCRGGPALEFLLQKRLGVPLFLMARCGRGGGALDPVGQVLVRTRVHPRQGKGEPF